MCTMIQSIYNIQMHKLELQIQLIQMQTCVQLIQHQMDTGACRGQEQGCFDQIGNCIGIGTNAMQTFQDQANSEIDRMAGATDNFLDRAQEAARNLGDAFDYIENAGYNNVNMQIRWGSTGNKQGSNICTYDGEETGGSSKSCRESGINFWVDTSSIRSGTCQGSLRVLIDGSYAESINYLIRADDVAHNIGLNRGESKQVKPKLFCDKNGNNAMDSREYINDFNTVTIMRATERDCECNLFQGSVKPTTDMDSTQSTAPTGEVVTLIPSGGTCSYERLQLYVKMTNKKADCGQYKFKVEGAGVDGILQASGDDCIYEIPGPLNNEIFAGETLTAYVYRPPSTTIGTPSTFEIKNCLAAELTVADTNQDNLCNTAPKIINTKLTGISEAECKDGKYLLSLDVYDSNSNYMDLYTCIIDSYQFANSECVCSSPLNIHTKIPDDYKNNAYFGIYRRGIIAPELITYQIVFSESFGCENIMLSSLALE